MDEVQVVPVEMVARAVGMQLRRARETREWSRAQLSERLPSGVVERTILSYEYGTRQVTVTRLHELCQTLKVSTPDLVQRALQAARIDLQNLTLRVDLRALMASQNQQFRPLMPWARNKMNAHPHGVVEVAPAGVEELAAFLGQSKRELANYLARFTPDPVDEERLVQV